MKIHFFLILFLLPVSVLGQSRVKPNLLPITKPAPTPNKKHVDVESIELDRTEITLSCPPGFLSKSEACADDSQLIAIRTKVSKENVKDLKYKYTVTGGFIRGTGANVRWDLWDLRPGTYELTVAVDDGCGFCGASKVATVTVAQCPDCNGDCECPEIGVTGPSGDTTPGESLTFTANVSGGSQESITYDWAVSAGKITSGQGTPSITVSTKQDTVTATVKIGGPNPSCNCLQTASATAHVSKPTP
ncbi:MAG TPA: hypothetical protein VL325_05160 [Pyrinomonadaceae bacterium]|jgi:hypothetical protein|nr:hypothetical protein [Pyrinomonadaceae bacterium]